MADNSPDPGPAAPLDAERLAAGLAAAGVGWRDVAVLAATGSTNTDLVAAVAGGRARSGSIIAAGEQTAGRGRLGRQWASPPGTTVSFSVALDPPLQRAGFLPALTGLAVVRALEALAPAAPVSLKWPNDVLLDGRKTAGILAEAAAGLVVVGCGINVSIAEEDLPVPEATSLRLGGIAADRTDVLTAVLVELHRTYQRWADAGFSAEAAGLLAAYRAVCTTLGRRVRVHLPDGGQLSGRADDVDGSGRLVVATDSGRTTLTAGDVVHLRS